MAERRRPVSLKKQCSKLYNSFFNFKLIIHGTGQDRKLYNSIAVASCARNSKHANLLLIKYNYNLYFNFSAT